MDDELRELERRWRRSGDPADQARWLLARQRAGALPAARLKLAAELGHPGAMQATGVAARPASVLARCLAGHSAEALARGMAAVAAGRLELPGAAAAVRDGRAEAPLRLRVQALAAAERWIVCPCEPHAHAADAAASSGGHVVAAGDPARIAATYAGRGLPFPDQPDRSAWLTTYRLPEDAPSRSAAVDEVGDWLLGLRDAVALRAPLWASLPPPEPPLALPPPPPPRPRNDYGWGGGRVDGIEASDD